MDLFGELKKNIKPKSLCVRVSNCLYRNDITSFDDFKKLSSKDLLSIQNLGPKSYWAIIKLLKRKKILLKHRKCPCCGRKMEDYK